MLVTVVVVVAGVHVHSFGWPGGTQMPGHARSPFGAVTSHCSPSSSTPLPHTKSIVWASVWKRSVTRCPMIVAAPPTRVFANGANKRASKIDLSPKRTSDPITLIWMVAGLPTGSSRERVARRRMSAMSIVAGAFTMIVPKLTAVSEQKV